MDFIIDNWTDIYIEILIYQNEQFRYIAENISKLKEKCNKKNIPVFDDKILSLTKIFNDLVFEKYGFDYLLEGIHNLIAFNCQPSYVLKDTIKKGCLKEKNRMKILKILQEPKPHSMY
jgi:hypothetical protein